MGNNDSRYIDLATLLRNSTRVPRIKPAPTAVCWILPNADSVPDPAQFWLQRNSALDAKKEAVKGLVACLRNTHHSA